MHQIANPQSHMYSELSLTIRIWLCICLCVCVATCVCVCVCVWSATNNNVLTALYTDNSKRKGEKTFTHRLNIFVYLHLYIEYLLGWGKGGNVTSAGWQITLCDPI